MACDYKNVLGSGMLFKKNVFLNQPNGNMQQADNFYERAIAIYQSRRRL